jgi:hypothetical protein
VHLVLVAGWSAYFGGSTWAGYQPGNSPVFFGATPRSLYFFNTVLAGASFFLAMNRWKAGQPTGALLVFAGAYTVEILIWIATPQLRQDSNLWPIDAVFVAGEAGFPVLIGRMLAGALTETALGQRFVSRFENRRRS